MTNTPADLCCGGVLVLTFLMLCFALYSLQNGVNEFLDAGLLFFRKSDLPHKIALSLAYVRKM